MRKRHMIASGVVSLLVGLGVVVGGCQTEPETATEVSNQPPPAVAKFKEQMMKKSTAKGQAGRPGAR